MTSVIFSGTGHRDLKLTNVTVTNNQGELAGGIYVAGPGTEVLLRNSIVFGNTSTSNQNYNDIHQNLGQLIAQGPNIIGVGADAISGDIGLIIQDDPLLSRLAYHGGTATHALLVGSSALDTADETFCPETDQRGVVRPQGIGCDIGAFELMLGDDAPQLGPIFTVNTTADALDTVCGTEHCSLREAVIAANAYNGTATVSIPAGTYTLSLAGTRENYGVMGDLDVRNPMIILGAGAEQTIINGGGIDRVFDVDIPPTFNPDYYIAFSLQGVTVTNGTAPVGEDGGAIRAANGVNHAISIKDSVITQNRTLDGNGGGLGLHVVSFTMQHSILSDNAANGGSGGGASVQILQVDYDALGIPNSSSGGVDVRAWIEHTLIGNNTAAEDGGGLWLTLQTPMAASEFELSVANSTIDNNTADGNGGGLWLSGPDISRSTISNNTATNGGGLYTSGVRIDQSVFNGNFATNDGGGVYGGWTNYMANTLSGNRANNNGGAIFASGPSYLNYSTITRNIADYDGNGSGNGGGVYSNYGASSSSGTYFFGSIIAGNQANSAPDCFSVPGKLAYSAGYNLLGNLNGCQLGEYSYILGALQTDLHGQDPLLGPLQDNGGPTLTHLPLVGSPVIDANLYPFCLDQTPIDQRGVVRRYGRGCDIGAVEISAHAIILPTVANVYTIFNGKRYLSHNEVLIPTSSNNVYGFGVAVFDITFNSDDLMPGTPHFTTDFRLLATGANGFLQTEDCVNTGGDDQVLNINNHYTRWLRMTGELEIVVMPAISQHGQYRLIICDTFETADGIALDGDDDGVPGGNFILDFYIGTPVVQRGPTFIVNQTTDTKDGFCTPVHCSLREAIIAANAYNGGAGGATVSIPAGTYTLSIAGTNEDASATGDLDITANMTITGANRDTTIIDANQIDRVLHIVGSASVTISNLTVRNGFIEADEAFGGGIYAPDAEVQLTSVAIRDNLLIGASVASGGGYLGSNQATITNSLISNNVATSNFEGFGFGGGIVSAGTTTIVDSQISMNQSNGLGGGIYHDAGDLTISAVQITDNQALSGAGVNIGNAPDNIGTVHIENSQISANVAADSGGGILQVGLETTLINTTMSGNTARYGAGIINGWGNLTLFNSTVWKNITTTSDPGVSGDQGSFVAVNIDESSYPSLPVQIINTIIADGGDAAPSCNFVGVPVTFSGTNLSDDASCGTALVADPLLGPLANNGGGTLTHALLPNSPALNRATTPFCPVADQRGVQRPQGPACDIGAYEGGASPAAAPSDLVATLEEDGTVRLTWHNNWADATSFAIDRSADGQNWEGFILLGGFPPPGVGETFADDTDPLECITNFYRVSVAVSETERLYSNVAYAEGDCPPPAAPDNVVANSTGAATAAITWSSTNPNSFDQFRVERLTGDAGVLSGSAWGEIAALPNYATSHTDNNLSCGTTYSYRVRAYRAADDTYSDYSDYVTITTDGCDAPVTNTVGLYRNGIWQFRDQNTSGAPTLRFVYGPQEAGWQPLTGDWDGDGTDGIGLYKDGIFLLRNATGAGAQDLVFRFGDGQASWQALAGDWNGDGIDTIGLFKNGQVILRNSNSAGGAEISFRFTFPTAGMIAVAGDFDASGADSVGLYKDGMWYLHNSLTDTSGIRAFAFGPAQSGWLPITGDWNADGVTTVGLQRGDVWRLRESNSAGGADVGFNFGVANDISWLPLASYRGGMAVLTVISQGLPNPLDISATPLPEVTEPVVTPTAPPLEATPEVTPPAEEITPTEAPPTEAPTAEPTASPAPPEATAEAAAEATETP